MYTKMMKNELVENMMYAMETRSNLIEKYDPELNLKDSINEKKWINHVISKINRGWVPDSGEVTLEVHKTIEFGLFLRREVSVSHPAVDSIEYSSDSTVIKVNFSKKLD
jgi:hypothetical protein